MCACLIFNSLCVLFISRLSFNALLAPFASLDKLRNLTLFDAIIPVSEPDENAEKISSTKRAKNKKEIELAPKEFYM